MRSRNHAIVAVPGDFPLWLKIEQAACGLLLIGVVVKAWRTKSSRRESSSTRS